MSEKIDGVRALWDGRTLQTRTGKLISAPAWFFAQLPDTPLDGELTLGRGTFQATVGAVRRCRPVGDEWAGMHFKVFDVPLPDLGFEARLDIAHAALGQCAVAEVVPHTRARGADHVMATLRATEAAGGEGVMLRRPGSRYYEGRSPDLLKVKTEVDAEAVLIACESGRGRLHNKVGAFVCRFGNKVFRLGAGIPDRLRTTPPSPGSAITFACRGFTDGGMPRHASFIAVRDYE